MSDGTATSEQVVDAEVVEDATPVQTAAVATSTELAPRQRRSEVIRPLDGDQLIQSFEAYQDLLPRLLAESDYQEAGRGKKFVKKSGWRKIATAFDLDVQIIRSEVDRDTAGQPVRAEVWARAIAPSGRAMDGDGYCSVDEERFSGPYGNTSKLENDLRATATTRAKNRAISDLVGMGEVSAEEVDASSGHASIETEASPELKQNVRVVLTYLLAGDERAVSAAVDAMTKHFNGRLPRSAGNAVLLVAKAVKDQRDPAPTTEPAA